MEEGRKAKREGGRGGGTGKGRGRERRWECESRMATESMAGEESDVESRLIL